MPYSSRRQVFSVSRVSSCNTAVSLTATERRPLQGRMIAVENAPKASTTAASTSSIATAGRAAAPCEVTPLSAMPHGTIRPKCSRSVADVQREAVARHPARDAHADRGELRRRRPRRPSGRRAARPAMPKRGDGADQHLFEVAHVAVHVAAIRLQIDDRIADELPGAVVGDVAAAARLERARRRAPPSASASRGRASGRCAP